MEKTVWLGTGMFGIVSWLSTFYVMFNQQQYKASTLYYMIILSMVLALMFIIMDPKAEKRTVNIALGLLIGLVVLVGIMLYSGLV